MVKYIQSLGIYGFFDSSIGMRMAKGVVGGRMVTPCGICEVLYVRGGRGDAFVGEGFSDAILDAMREVSASYSPVAKTQKQQFRNTENRLFPSV